MSADLIARLEALTGPDREVDALIGKLVGTWRGKHGYADEDVHLVPPYTASIDSAMTLVPEGPWNGDISWNFGDLKRGGFVELNKANPAWLEPDYDPSQGPDDHAACVSSYEDREFTIQAPEPRPLAIALCIAALRARDTEGTEA